jgi:integrase
LKVTFTDRFIQTLKPPIKGRNEYLDQKVLGLALRVSKNGRKTYSVYYRMLGNPTKQRETIGTHLTVSLAEARTSALKIIADAQKAIAPNLKLKAIKQEPFVKDLITEFWERELSNKKSAKDMYRLLVKDVIPSWGNKKVSSITRRDVVILLDKIRDRGAPITANRLHGRLTRLFNFACERGILDESPMTRLRKTEESPRERVLDDNEIKIFWLNIDKVGIHPKTALALKLMLTTSQRAGEVTSISWNEIDLNAAIWRIPPEKSKNGRAHIVPLTQTSLDLLKQAKALSKNSAYVFPSPLDLKGAKPLEVRSLSRAISRKHSLMKIDKFVPHDIRRSVRTKFAELGVDEVVAERALNHHLQGLARVYNQHDYQKEIRIALTLWEKRLLDLIETVEV